MNNSTLTPRQREAQRLNQKIYRRYTRPVLAPVWMAVVFAWLTHETPYDYFGRIPHNFQVLIGITLFIGVVGFVIFAGGRANEAVRAAGLMDEKLEIIARTATTFEGKTLTFEDERPPWKKLGFVLTLVSVAALTVWCGIYIVTMIADRIVMGFGFVFFFGFSIHSIVNWSRPYVRLDERGVSGYHHDFWPRLVRWPEIESAHFHRWTNFHDGAGIYMVTLKNAEGQTLLKLSSATFNGAPPEFEERFVAELRRRLTGGNSAQNEELNCG